MQPDGFESQFWADHHEEFSDGLDALFGSIMPAFRRLVAQLYEAPWLVAADDDPTPPNCATKVDISCTI